LFMALLAVGLSQALKTYSKTGAPLYRVGIGHVP